MVKIENHCCGCASPGYPCQGNSCPNRNVKVYYCDECDPKCEEPLGKGEVYDDGEQELCEACLLKKYRKED